MRPCLACGYDLSGLPEVHDCPECGMGLDPLAFAIELRVRFDWLRRLWPWFCIVLMLPIMVRKPTGIGQAVIAPLSAIGIFTVARASKGGDGLRLIVNRLGVHVWERTRTARSVSWSEIGDVCRSFVDGAVIVRAPSGKKLLHVVAGHSRWDEQGAAELILQVKRNYECNVDSQLAGPRSGPDGL